MASLDKRDPNPAADYPPTRPNLTWLLIFAVVVLFGTTIMNWSKVSAFAHIPQLEHAIGL